MEPSIPIQRSLPWQPITPKGVAGFARAPLGWLLAYQFVFALISGLSVGWLAYATIYPSLETAVGRLPQEGEIRAGTLRWTGGSPLLLSETRIISIAVDLDHTGRTRVPSDIFVELGEKSWRAFSFAGYCEFPYSRSYIISLNKPGLMPWWGAWRGPILVLVVLGSTIAVLLLWWLIATLYCPVALLIAFFGNKWAKSYELWRLCAAAAMPASMVLWTALLLYGTAAAGLLPFLLLVVLHVVMSWIYAGISVGFLPGDGSLPTRGNPFKKSG